MKKVKVKNAKILLRRAIVTSLYCVSSLWKMKCKGADSIIKAKWSKNFSRQNEAPNARHHPRP
jgi:hypothetical protein